MDLEALKKKLTGIRKDQWVLVLLVGILLAVIAMPVSEEKKEAAQGEDGTQNDTADMQDVTKLEARLAAILGQMEGAGRVRVMITQKTSGEKIVEKDIPSSDREIQEQDEGGSRSTTEREREETTVYERDGSGRETPYVTQETAPQIEGVLVLAEGGSNAVVIKNITDAVMALFDLEAHKIKVMKMN